tara:strand:+ start:58 stop:864 length:807 start_codon:yes stop_codon:yes gene_type:complete
MSTTNKRLEGKVAIVTGGSSGIGRETVLLFIREGANVVIADVNAVGAEETIMLTAPYSSIDQFNDRVIFVKTDVSKSEDCQNMVRVAEERFGKLDILFNNAGIMHSADDDAVQTEEQIWDLTMNINLKGVFLGCKYGIPALRRNGGGSIINTASVVALVGSATPQLAYTASKGGVIALTQELAVVHAKEKIRVNALCPGPLRTELLMKFLNTEEKKQRRLVHIPMGRFGESKEMAQAALFLASDESKYMTGAKFVVDGGLTSAYVTPE